MARRRGSPGYSTLAGNRRFRVAPRRSVLLCCVRRSPGNSSGTVLQLRSGRHRVLCWRRSSRPRPRCCRPPGLFCHRSSSFHRRGRSRQAAPLTRGALTAARSGAHSVGCSRQAGCRVAHPRREQSGLSEGRGGSSLDRQRVRASTSVIASAPAGSRSSKTPHPKRSQTSPLECGNPQHAGERQKHEAGQLVAPRELERCRREQNGHAHADRQ